MNSRTTVHGICILTAKTHCILQVRQKSLRTLRMFDDFAVKIIAGELFFER